MSLTGDDIRRIAELARLEVDDAELVQLQAQLNDVFVLIEALQAVDTRGVEPMTHAQTTGSRMRADEVTEPDRRDELQRVAPSVESGLYLVPRVIE